MTFFDGIEIGASEELGSHLFTAEEIVRFAKRYDPQPFHLDPEAAKETAFGALCASGWHTSAVMMRLIVESNRRRVRAFMAAGNPAPRLGPSPGARNIRWIRPVFAGERVTYHQSVTGKAPSKSRAGWGVVETKVEAFNQDGLPVFSMEGAVFIGTD